MAERARAIVGLAMLQQDGLDVRMAGKDVHQFGSAVAAETDDSDRGAHEE